MLTLIARRAAGQRFLGPIFRRFFLFAWFVFASLLGTLWGIMSAKAQRYAPSPIDECNCGCNAGYNNLGNRINYDDQQDCPNCNNDDCEVDTCYDLVDGCGYLGYCIASNYVGNPMFDGCQGDYQITLDVPSSGHPTKPELGR
jgi:hypothetical protein